MLFVKKKKLLIKKKKKKKSRTAMPAFVEKGNGNSDSH